MNVNQKSLLVGMCVFGLVAASVPADVIVDQAYIDTGPPWNNMLRSGSGWTLGIYIDDLGSGDYNFEYYLIFEEFRFYEASFLMELTPSYVNATTPIVSNSGEPFSSLQSFSLGETKLYAFWEDTDGVIGAGSPDETDNFGWVTLTYTGSDLVVGNSATALGGGIIVGTYNQIPEPATALLLGIGGFGAWLLRRNRCLVSGH